MAAAAHDGQFRVKIFDAIEVLLEQVAVRGALRGCKALVVRQVFDQLAHGRRGNVDFLAAQRQSMNETHTVDGHLPTLRRLALIADPTQSSLLVGQVTSHATAKGRGNVGCTLSRGLRLRRSLQQQSQCQCSRGRGCGSRQVQAHGFLSCE